MFHAHGVGAFFRAIAFAADAFGDLGAGDVTRPEGSMQVLKLIWWEHDSKAGQYSSAKVHGSLKVNADGSYELEKLDGLTPQEIDGF